ncbi:extracellular solute-binding protein [Nakamurella antarctica]|uniref:Extracellular solute-binding protein n=1 Tax=Nakamurella antarctica TaxID=1902245 RepID=A0A3G8ZIP4_9ACTN|nr:extracellular solute-binding protein [Nakamurella antarctica]AZI57048.1 extracellular solute-binding protein [Nakamurella antarctica]
MTGPAGLTPASSPGARMMFRPGPRLSRRRFMQTSALGASAAFLAACGINPARPGRLTVPDRSDMDKFVNWSNWQGYMDVDANDSSIFPTLVGFQDEYGITVNYTEDVNDNTEYFSKIHPQIAAGQTITADLFVVTDWMAAKLIQLEYVQELDHANIPNLANLNPALQKVTFDPGRKYSATWQSGLAGIAVNHAVVGKDKTVESMNQLLTDPSLAGRITLLKEMRDTVALCLQDLGYDASDFTDSQFMEAINMIGEAVNSGQVRQFTGNDYVPSLVSGDLAACAAWTGDVVALQNDSDDFEMVLPKAGYPLWSDNCVIPAAAAHKKNAEMIINYYYEPRVAATLSEYVNYITPIPTAKAFAAEDDPAIANNQLIFPGDEILSNAHVFMALDGETDARYSKIFDKLSGA